MVLAGAADHPATPRVVPAAQLALPGEDRGVAPLRVGTVVVSDAPGVLGGRRGGRPGGGGGGWMGGRGLGETHYSVSIRPVTDRAQIPLISGGWRGVSTEPDITPDISPAVEEESVIGITLIISTGSTGKQTGTLGAALPELGAI